jgi:hypothetical protein
VTSCEVFLIEKTDVRRGFNSFFFFLGICAEDDDEMFAGSRPDVQLDEEYEYVRPLVLQRQNVGNEEGKEKGFCS